MFAIYHKAHKEFLKICVRAEEEGDIEYELEIDKFSQAVWVSLDRGTALTAAKSKSRSWFWNDTSYERPINNFLEEDLEVVELVRKNV